MFGDWAQWGKKGGYGREMNIMMSDERDILYIINVLLILISTFIYKIYEIGFCKFWLKPMENTLFK